nr:MAG TPA: AAA domain protein [Caudoviricetes sp.]
MKIAFAGAGGTGKGTLVNIISTDYEIPVIRSPVQDVGKMIFPDAKNYIDILNYDAVNRWAFQYSIVMSQIFLEKRLALTDLAYVSERSLFDYLAYASPASEESLHKHENRYLKYEEMILRAYKENPYDIIFYIPYDDFKPDDKETAAWKERDEESRKATDVIIRKALNCFADDSEVVTLRGSIKEREEKICREIQMLLY